MIVQKYIILIMVALSLIGGAFAFGWNKGSTNEKRKAEESRQEIQEKILDLNKDLAEKNAAILKINREKEDLINDLENQALAAKGSDGPGVGSTGGLQRLERRWRSSTTSP
jgi:hypothetical protein